MSFLGNNAVLSNVRTNYLGGGIQHGTDTVMPTGHSPNTSAGLNIVAGWPLYWLYPNREYVSRYSLSASMLLEDLSNGEGILKIPAGLSIPDKVDPYVYSTISMEIGGLGVKWHMNVSKCELSLGSEYASVMSTNQIATSPSYYTVDNGVDMSDPVAQSISNHFIILYGALERGFGRMKHGWFYADVGGTWTWSVDGLDATEIAINGGVVASKYSNSSTVGQGVLYGSLSLPVGWHHLFAYTSDRSDSSYPRVWFKRPGDLGWTQLASDMSDGIVWCRGIGVPESVVFSRNSGFITVNVAYGPGVDCSVSVPETEFKGGTMAVTAETTPRYRPYYTNNWLDSGAAPLPCPVTTPPEFIGMRGIVEFAPLSEVLFYLDDVPHTPYVQKVLISRDGVFWYKWSGSAFVSTSASSVDELLSGGTALNEVNDIPRADWISFLDGDKTCKAMFTGPAPLVLVRNDKLLDTQSGADYIVGTKSVIAGTVSLNKRQI